MVSLTRLNEFRKRVSEVPTPDSAGMVALHKVTAVKAHILECYQNVSETVEANLDSIEDAFIEVLKKSINGAVGRPNEQAKKKPKG